MMKATIEKELLIEMPNKVGIAAKLATLISDQAKINIKVLWGRIVDGKGKFSLITDNSSKVADILKNSDFNNFKEQNILIVKTANNMGACTAVAKKIGKAGIDINYLLTTIVDNDPAIVISTNNDREALSLFD